MAFKKNRISENLEDYSICLLGESGIGKTTTMVEMCEKEFGEDGYVIFNMGKEQGIDCIDNATYEDIPDWKTFDSTIKDIVKNKDTEFKDLKVVVLDTLDQAIEITEPECVRRWNSENLGKKDFVPAKTLNASWGGFGRGEDKVIELILDKIWELQKVGIRVYYVGHVKTREIVDPITNQTYTTLSTNMMTKYFNGFKTKMHVVGVACIDRTIETESTGRKNIVTKKDITVNKIKEERRKIVFRDDSYSVDSKSRLAGIVDEIPMNSDELIKALKDAIKNSKKSTSNTTENPKAAKKEESKPVVEEVIEDIDEDIDSIEETTSGVTADDIRALFKSADKDTKSKVKEIITEYGGKLDNADQDGLDRMYEILNA